MSPAIIVVSNQRELTIQSNQRELSTMQNIMGGRPKGTTHIVKEIESKSIERAKKYIAILYSSYKNPMVVS